MGKATHVKVVPKCQRAKNRVREHGEVMVLDRYGECQGKPAVHVTAFDGWRGWFDISEARVVELGIVDMICEVPALKQ